MKVKAKHNINHNGIWYIGGQEFEVNPDEMAEISDYVSVVERVSEIFPPDEPKRRGRKKSEQ